MPLDKSCYAEIASELDALIKARRRLKEIADGLDTELDAGKAKNWGKQADTINKLFGAVSLLREAEFEISGL